MEHDGSFRFRRRRTTERDGSFSFRRTNRRPKSPAKKSRPKSPRRTSGIVVWDDSWPTPPATVRRKQKKSRVACPPKHTFVDGMCRDALGFPVNPRLYAEWAQAQRRLKTMR